MCPPPGQLGQLLPFLYSVPSVLIRCAGPGPGFVPSAGFEPAHPAPEAALFRWPPPPRGRSKRKANRVKRSVSIRHLPDPVTMGRVIDAIESHQPASRAYQVMTAVAYYAGLRPSEVVMLRAQALELPRAGWGRIHVTEADVAFDEPGEPKTGPRSVPIPPRLIEVLQSWVNDHGFAKEDLLFRTRNGLRPRASNWSRALHRALLECECPPLRIYDCRHAAATTWLRAGVPLGEVAKRMGHSVETLVSTYVGALAGDETLANERIEAALAGTDGPTTPGVPAEPGVRSRSQQRARRSVSLGSDTEAAGSNPDFPSLPD